MLKHIRMPIAVASVAAIVALAWMMIIDPDLVAGQSSQSARAHITVQIGSGDDTVSWYDPDGCTSKYNLYLYVNTPVPGSSTGQNHPHTPWFCPFRQHTGNLAYLSWRR